MKKEYKIYLEPREYESLLKKASTVGCTGRGSLSHFISKIAVTDIVFLDKNVKDILSLFQLQQKKGYNPFLIVMYIWKDAALLLSKQF